MPGCETKNTTAPSIGHGPAVKVAHEMIAEIARIVAGAVDQRRLATPQELHAHQVHARRVDHAAVVTDAALAIEHGDVQPRQIGAVAGRPDDRADAGAGEVQGERRRASAPRWAAGGSTGSTSPSRPFAVAHSSIVLSSRFILRSDSAHWLRSEPENCALPSRMPTKRPTIRTPMAVSALRSRVARSVEPVELQRGDAARPVDVVDRVVALVEHAGRVHPPLDVPAAIDAGRPDVLADGDRHRAARSDGSRRRAGCPSPRRRRPARRPPATGRDGGRSTA